MGVEPVPSASQADVPTAYTTDTMLNDSYLPPRFSGRRGSRTLKAAKLDRLPTGSRHQSGSPSVSQQLDQDSNWNLSLEARHDVRFTIEPKAEGMGFEPT